MFPGLSLTPENLSTVLDSMDDSLWVGFSQYVNIPDSERWRIRSQYSSNRECKQATINSLISGHPAPSWRLVAHALYQMGTLSGGDSSHRVLDCLQQLFPTGSAIPCAVSTTCVQRVCLTCACMLKIACKCVYVRFWNEDCAYLYASYIEEIC